MMFLNEKRELMQVDSMNLLFSGNHHQYESYYVESLGLIDNSNRVNRNALKPILGMLSHNDNNLKMLPMFVNALLSQAK